MDGEYEPSQLQLDAQPPFGFALSLEGDLLLSFQLSGLPMGLKVPAVELAALRRLLEATDTIRGMLGVKPPERGAH